SELCQRKNLESTGIRKNRAVPVHKLMQSSELLHYLVSRSYMKMIGIGKFHLGLYLMEVHGRYCSLNSGSCSHIHKDRSFNCSVYGFHPGSFSPSFLSQYCIHKFFPLLTLFLHLFFLSEKIVCNIRESDQK